MDADPPGPGPLDPSTAATVGDDRLRRLLRATIAITGELALPTVLRRIVEAACDLLAARYGALGVIGADGSLEQFVHVGLDADTVQAIGTLPTGRGLVGAVISEGAPIRIAHLGEDPRFCGFPAHHPPMDSFLGVPIRIRQEVFGNLYLADRRDGRAFTAEDQEVAQALAATAATAIENARLYTQAGQRQNWLAASGEITRELFAHGGGAALTLIAEQVHDLADADAVTVVLPSPDPSRLLIEVAIGGDSASLTGSSYPVARSLAAHAIASGHPVVLADAAAQHDYEVHLARALPIGPLMTIPLAGYHRPRGALMVVRHPGRRPFSAADVDMAMTFANHAAVALELADARSDAQRLALLEDRDRIARDLHDHVIQRLFAAGLTIEGLVPRISHEEDARRLSGVVDQLDLTIQQIRASIFELRAHAAPALSELRMQVLTVVTEFTPALGFSPELHFSGPIDTLVGGPLREQVVAVVREALSNAARHARADSVRVSITATVDRLTVEIVDDGVGIGAAAHRGGLANLRVRAESCGGTLTITHTHGTSLTWSVPLRDPESRRVHA